MGLDIPAAEAAYRRASKRSPTALRSVPDVLVKLGDALQPLGRLVESVAAYEEAISALACSRRRTCCAASRWTDLGRVLWRHGDTQRAREVSVEAVTLLEGVETRRWCSRTAAPPRSTR
jgi:hypothetical protein